jgi:hypothetical protein
MRWTVKVWVLGRILFRELQVLERHVADLSA